MNDTYLEFHVPNEVTVTDEISQKEKMLGRGRYVAEGGVMMGKPNGRPDAIVESNTLYRIKRNGGGLLLATTYHQFHELLNTEQVVVTN